MIDRRDFLLGSIGAGFIALSPSQAALAASTIETIRETLRRIVGTDGKGLGMIAVALDEHDTHLVSYGSSGAAGVALNWDTVVEIGSMTKVMTALILADMVSRGEVAFDDPVSKHLPPSVRLHTRGRPITLLDIATYTSGLPNTPGNFRPPLATYTVDKLYEFLSTYVPQYEPGSHYEYSNLSFALLGNALAYRAGATYEELLIERVCKPLGLDHTRISLTADMRHHLAQGHDRKLLQTPLLEMPALQGMGAVRSSAKDLTVFLKACMRLVPTPLSATLDRLLETRKHTSLPGTDVGLGWFISADDKDEIVWKSGVTGGFKTFVAFSMRTRRGAAVLSNFLWSPIDDDLGIQFVDPDFHPGDFKALYSND